MSRGARGMSIDPAKVQVVHCIHRCVRRAHLCGFDQLSGRSFDHRRMWIRRRLEFLASVFGIECVTYSIMENHLHLILRSRPDVVINWTDREVALRWLRLFPVRRKTNGAPQVPTEAEIAAIVNNPDVLAARRKRLSDISWWMRCTAENIARRSNDEDDVTGHFWESRFKSQVLLDEPSLLACAIYVDLNPVRAAMAKTLETSLYTGVKDRLDDLAAHQKLASESDRQWERGMNRPCSGWLSPIEFDQCEHSVGNQMSRGKRRASDKGVLPVSLTKYLQLLEWTGQQIRKGKRGKLPDDLTSILDRIGLESQSFCELIVQFGRRFRRAVGRPSAMRQEAERRGQRWLWASVALV